MAGQQELKEQCGTCWYWIERKCRRYAPRPSDNAGRASWPTTDENDWCGEYVPLERKKPGFGILGGV
jgi:hypothetical protein